MAVGGNFVAPVQKEDTLSVRLTSTLRTSCVAAAAEAGLTLADWIRAVLARAANEGAFGPRKTRKRNAKG